MATNKNTAVEVPELPRELLSLLENPDAVASADTFEALAAALGIDDTAAVSPWRVIKDKGELLNRPFYIRSWKYSDSKDFVGSFVIVQAVTYDNGEMVIFTDGSTGIMKQLQDVDARRIGTDAEGVQGFLQVPNGLRVSEYWLDANRQITKDLSEKVSTGSTFYIG